MKLLIKYATRKRPALFLKAMDNILSTVTGDFRIIVSIDSDDSEMIRLVSERFFDNTQVFINDNFGGKIGAINANIPLTGWDWLVNTSDDMQFTVKGWDKIMIERIKSIWGDSLDFFANFNDGFQGPKLATMSIMGREYYERFFYIYAPCYRSLSCDAEAYYVAQSLGRYHYFPDQLYKHMHPANVKQVKSDALYVANEVYAKQDAKIYFQRLNRNFYVNNPGPTQFDRYKTR
jgi:hypothetical protein